MRFFSHNTVTFGRNEWNDTVYKWMNWRNWKQWTRSNICLWLLLIYKIKVLIICTKDLVKCGFMKLGELTNFLFMKHTIHKIGSGFWAIYFGPGLLRRLLDCDPNGQYPSRFVRATCTQMIRPLWKDRSVGKSTLHFLKQKNGPYLSTLKSFVLLDTCVVSNEGILILVLHGLAGVEFKIVKTDLTIRMCDNQ